MPKLLMDEYPLLVLPSLAKAIGLNEAIILQQVNYWLQNLEQTKRKEPEKYAYHCKEGRVWIYNTYTEWGEQFPFWSIATIKRTLRSLEKSGYLLTGNFNAKGYDQTRWYAIDFDKINTLENKENEKKEPANPRISSLGQNDPMDKVKMTQSLGQNDPTNTRDYLTETSTDTTTTQTAVVVPSASLQETDAERELVVKAEACGIKKATTTKHIRQKGLSAVSEKISLLEKAIAEGQKKGKPIVTPGAWLNAAFKEDYTDSKGEFEAAQATRKAEAQEKAAALQRAAEEALLAEVEEAPALDPSSPFAQIAARLGVMKAM